MNHRILSATLLGACLAASMYAEEGRIAERKENQQGRIAQGVKSGELTPRETARIERREAAVNHEVRRDRRENGGKLTAQQKKQVNRQQDRLSKDIYHQKHDAQQVK